MTARSEPDAHAPRTSALHRLHEELGARFTEFGGWQMPVRYGSIVEEHQAVRRAAGLLTSRTWGSSG